MISQKDVQRLVENKIITLEQAQEIIAFEGKNHSKNFSKKMFIVLYAFAGFLLSLGIISLVASNWSDISDGAKLFFDFVILGGFLYGAYWSSINQRDGLKELFLVLSFSMIAATIGLVAQIFNIEGGWKGFLLAWTLLGLPFVFASRMLWFGSFWWVLLIVTVFYELDLFDWLFHEDYPIKLFCLILIFLFISYLLKVLDKETNKYTLLAKSGSKIYNAFAYFVIFIEGNVLNLEKSFDRDFTHMFSFILFTIFAISFFVVKLFFAAQKKDIKAFQSNIILFQLYIFIAIFTSFWKSLFTSGIGFFLSGLLVIFMIICLKKSLGYSRNSDMFK